MGIAVVVGGGCSGVLATRELLRNGWHVVLVDPGARPGRGLAYSTAAPWHLLNSPAAAMSADPDRPDDFLRWCRLRDPRTGPADFVPRSWYGDYLTETLRAADETAQGRLTVQRGRVARIFEPSGHGGPLTVLLTDDVVIPADRVVLALGHPAPSAPARLDAAAARSGAYVADPWRPGALDDLPEGPILLIGTGLTAVDVALTLANAGRHDLTAVSRHGLLPQPHRRPAGPGPAAASQVTQLASGATASAAVSALASAAADTPGGVSAPVSPAQAAAQVQVALPELLAARSAAGLLRSLRRLAAETGDWRAVFDALRPHWDALWQSLPEPGQHRFLRHLARYWEVHRHRMAPDVADSITALRDSGSLRVRAAELCGIEAADEGVRVVLRERHGGAITAPTFAAVVNCTGPGRIVESDPLVRALVAEGMARPGPYRLGLDTDPHGALLRRDGSAHPALWTLGPTRRGVLWETTAAPEIRTQARALAVALGDAGHDRAPIAECVES
ncbi:FAD/NAD(P)-binding protein [Catellatospora chokoriensis]|uniref:Pyridine nucleotide-disulfide oxidoreductase n=1 Tax=Catellatospora chokoriensis TaxID=310353 RepID=A0A8J3K0U9_9ACTN|nr:FAD/NAD(P)-binding protein [Catellatospora chokoriensis]GIF88428.1 pyridine nucleotide-disulfide oxidoreductase [Catellatospora chokoriensis]